MARLLTPVLALAGLLYTGCSAEQTIVLDAEGAGTATVAISVDPVFAAYLDDVAAGLGGDTDAPLFDPELIRASLSAQPGVSVRDVSAGDGGDLRIEVDFSSVSALLRAQGESATEILRFERTAAFRRLAATIDRQAIQQILGIGGVDPFIAETLLPPDDEMNAAEYRDYLAWAFEEYADQRPLDRVFGESRVVTTIEPAGSVVQMRGGEVTGAGVRYDIPLVEAVTARRPFRYSLVYAPAE